MGTLGTLYNTELSAFLYTSPQRKGGEMLWDVAGKVSCLISEFMLWGRVITLGVVAATEELPSDLPSRKELMMLPFQESSQQMASH